MFSGCRTPEETILDCFAGLAAGISLRGIHQIKGIKVETISGWLLKALGWKEEVEELLRSQYHLSRPQLNRLWANIWQECGDGKRRAP
jgi:hypothetical protein